MGSAAFRLWIIKNSRMSKILRGKVFDGLLWFFNKKGGADIFLDSERSKRCIPKSNKIEH